MTSTTKIEMDIGWLPTASRRTQEALRANGIDYTFIADLGEGIERQLNVRSTSTGAELWLADSEVIVALSVKNYGY